MTGPIQRLLTSFRSPWRSVSQLDALSDDDGKAIVAAKWPEKNGRRGPMLAIEGGCAAALFAAATAAMLLPGIGTFAIIIGLFFGLLLSLCLFDGPYFGAAPRLCLAVGVFATVAMYSDLSDATKAGAAALIVRSGAASASLGLLVGAVAFVMLRRQSLRLWIAAKLREDWCQGCAYPLFELPASDGPMECPRCRRPCIARESIRSAADLLACDVDAHADRARRPRPKVVTSCGCGYPLHGLPAAEGAVTCPECGAAYAAAPRGFTRLDAWA